MISHNFDNEGNLIKHEHHHHDHPDHPEHTHEQSDLEELLDEIEQDLMFTE